jgi:hypothetical protein
VGALLFLKEQDVDTLIIDYESERGGRLGVVFQVPKGQGRACDRWLAQCGVDQTLVSLPTPLLDRLFFWYVEAARFPEAAVAKDGNAVAKALVTLESWRTRWATRSACGTTTSPRPPTPWPNCATRRSPTCTARTRRSWRTAG